MPSKQRFTISPHTVRLFIEFDGRPADTTCNLAFDGLAHQPLEYLTALIAVRAHLLPKDVVKVSSKDGQLRTRFDVAKLNDGDVVKVTLKPSAQPIVLPEPPQLVPFAPSQPASSLPSAPPPAAVLAQLPPASDNNAKAHSLAVRSAPPELLLPTLERDTSEESAQVEVEVSADDGGCPTQSSPSTSARELSDRSVDSTGMPPQKRAKSSSSLPLEYMSDCDPGFVDFDWDHLIS